MSRRDRLGVDAGGMGLLESAGYPYHYMMAFDSLKDQLVGGTI